MKTKVLVRARRLMLALVWLLGTLLVAVSAAPQEGESPAAAAGTDTPLTAGGVPDAYIAVAESDALALYVDVDTAIVLVVDKASGAAWYSSPPGLQADDTMLQETVNQMKAQLIVTYLDELRNTVTTNSYLGSVLEGTYEVRTVEGGVRITYDFARSSMQFRIPVEIVIAGDGLAARILYDEIEERGPSRICTIDFLPYFGAGKSDEDGYLFLPDGCGALVRFDDWQKDAADYRRSVYGDDPSIDLLLKADYAGESIRLPVFGIKKGEAAFLAVIEESEANASIIASSSSRYSPYSAVGASFLYHPHDLTGIRDKQANQRVTMMLGERPVSASPRVCYYFLHGDDADYSGMARRYQTHLVDTYGLAPLSGEAPRHVALELFGKTGRQASFLGLPIRQSVTATTFAQAGDLLATLREQGAERLQILLYGFEKGGYENRYVTREDYDGSVGGSNGYRAFLDGAGDSGVYTVYGLTRDYDRRFGLFKAGRYVKSLNRVNVLRRNGLLSTGAWDEEGPAWQYVNRAQLLRSAQTLADSLTQAMGGAAFHHLGGELYSDHAAGAPMDRQEMLAAYREALTTVSGKARVAGDGGNAYLLGLTQLLYEVPLTTSGQDIFSDEVPFYAMVLHGYVELASGPVNNAGDRQEYLLRAYEAGIAPTYRLTAVDATELARTPLKGLYNSTASLWTQEIAQVYADFAPVHDRLYALRITAHRYEGDLSVTTYADGTRIVANRGDAVKTYEGQEIAASRAVCIAP